ncbi:MAG: GNAT family N-acetyltransferase [Bifidobacterium psychraerophilum]|jgi:GNAT superfamily N-acetyltransferase|uniref:GNAT family N-acetyltransferase n=3 Tax=Bifidobacterium psychraerophilum TaxID=218140 RepID=UPI0039EC64FF|nr:GNAT family N-acetyltransferase [Bifidobacterium psychraerophilum]
MMSDWHVEEISWDQQEGRMLRQEQRDELDARYGNDTHEPGTPPSADDVTVFLIARDIHGTAVACGGLRSIHDSALGSDVMEIKRMYATPKARGKGASTAILTALRNAARDRGAKCLVLETGTSQPDAIRFYEKHGFTRIPLFGAYRESKLSYCYASKL